MYVWFVVYEAVELTAIVLNWKSVAPATATALNPTLATMHAQLQVNALQYVGLALVVAWVVWFAAVAWNSASKLRALPYMAYRYRQLAFRMFAYMSVGVLIYLLAVSISAAVTILNNTSTTSTYTNSLGDAGTDFLLNKGRLFNS